jgi:hypothetical protein
MASVNQTRPHCLYQIGKTHSKALAARHGRGMQCVNRPLGSLHWNLCSPENCSPVLIIRTTFLNVHAFRQLITKIKFIFMNTCTRTGYESSLTGFLSSFTAGRTSCHIRRKMKVANRACCFIWEPSSSFNVREEHEMRMSENGVSSRIFERKGHKNAQIHNP